VHVLPRLPHVRARATGLSLRAGWLGRSSTSKGSNPAGWLSSPGKGGNFGERGREASGVAGGGTRYNTDTLDIEHVLRVRGCVSEGRLQPSARGAVANRMGVCFIVPIWAAIWLVVTNSRQAVGVAHQGHFLTLARGPAIPGDCPSPGTDCPGHRPRGQTDSPTSTTRSRLVPRSRREGERQRLWDTVAAQVHHPEPVIRADRRHRTWGRTEVGPRAEVRPADAGQVGAEGAYGPRPRTGKN
jgi:hypothetical protein